MCGVFGQEGLLFVEKGYSAILPSQNDGSDMETSSNGEGGGTESHGAESFTPNNNIWIGGKAYTVANDVPRKYQEASFGFSPTWAKERMYLFNARSEGDNNPMDNPDFTGDMGIFLKPAFKGAIRKQRCLIPMTHFVEGPKKEKLKQPFLVRRKDEQIFFAAGIWEDYIDKKTGEIIKTFAIITTSAPPLLADVVGHHRSPLILNEKDYEAWFDADTSIEALQAIMRPPDLSEFEAYPINPVILKTKQHDSGLKDPF